MSYVHKLADIGDCKIGRDSNIWQFVVILDGAVIGNNCNVCAQCLIEGDVVIGDRVTVKSGVQLWDGTRISDDVFIGPNATFTNDLYPRSKQYHKKFKGIMIGSNASIGANATILAGIKIGAFAMVGAGSVVTKDVPEYALVVGNPAKVIRYVDR